MPIGIVSGLTGLGGAEFRLPALVGLLGYTVRQAVPLNLSVSLFTLATSFFVRSRTLSPDGVLPLLPIVAGFVVGASTMSFLSPAIGARVSDDRLRRLILILLTLVGISLIYEGFRPLYGVGIVPAILPLRVAAGVAFALGIGFVSSLTGVAGGELQIPIFLLAFGADIKTAGTASLCVSRPTTQSTFSGTLRVEQFRVPPSYIRSFRWAWLRSLVPPSARRLQASSRRRCSRLASHCFS
jgi:uncharacterized membrane protein YfcA